MPGTIVEPTIFREYIGAKPESNLIDFPADIINPNVKEFHFILAFATEDYDETEADGDETTKTGTGNFNPNWDLSVFNAKSIQSLKDKHKNAKVIISIGGRGSQYPFNPAEKTIWLDSAKKSIKDIINDLNKSCSSGVNLIDGIDVNYENIKSSDGDFTDTIGKLIKSLKDEDLIKVASIAPSNSVRAHYKKLYENYGDYIRWVDYQFYDQTVSNKHDFVNQYNDLSRDYPHRFLLAGFSTDPSDRGKISKEVFLEACEDLFRRKLLPGIFVWDAEDSKVPTHHGDAYQLEKLAQQVIVDFHQTTPH